MKRRIIVALGFFSIAILISGCLPARKSSSPPPTTANCSVGIGPEIFNLLNATRINNGLPILIWDRKLACLAADWSKKMAENNTFYHRDLVGLLRDPNYREYRCLGENIGRGRDTTTSRSFHDAWMASLSHRENILSSTFSSVGISAYYLNGTVWITENFGCK